jgi:hypothetical protein
VTLGIPLIVVLQVQDYAPAARILGFAVAAVAALMLLQLGRRAVAMLLSAVVMTLGVVALMLASLPLFFFSPSVAAFGPLLEVSVEPTPTGEWTVRQFDARDTHTPIYRLRHSSIYDREDIAEAVAKSIARTAPLGSMHSDGRDGSEGGEGSP